MQINRLFEIVYLLLRRGRLTARELSERFEVSTKTIYRDVEVLSAAGIPVYMTKGHGGGIQLLEEYVLDRALLSEDDQNAILASLQGMSAVEVLTKEDTLQRLQALFQKREEPWIDVDFSDWGNVLKERFEALRSALLARRIVEFDYISSEDVCSHREVEPLQLCFRDRAWYLIGFCKTRGAQRMFRLSRMRRLSVTDRRYERRVLEKEADFDPAEDQLTTIRMRIAAPQRHRVLDEFREEDVQHNADGSYEVKMRLIVDEWVFGYIMSFGEAGEVIAPEWVRAEIQARLARSLQHYLK